VAADGPVAGFDQADIARYFVCTLLVRQLTGAWILWELNFEIRSGALSQKLLKPIHPLWYAALAMLGAMPFRVVVLLPLLAGVFVWRPELWRTPSLAELALFAVSVSLAWLLSYLSQAFFGILAFWMDRSMGLWGVWFALWMVLSGYVAPLGLFPDWAQGVLPWTPFTALLGTPVEILGGFLPLDQALARVGAQLVWVVAFYALVALTWQRGLRAYGAFGA
jgi:ABC-2 type transport system permease protein